MEQEIIQVSKKEALEALTKVDSLLGVATEAMEKVDSCFINLSFLLLKVKRGAFWTERGLRSEHEYIEQVFPQSRAQYYTFIRFANNLQGYDRKKLQSWGRSKCEDLVRLHVHFEGEVPAEWFGYIGEDNKDTFRRRVRAFFDDKDLKNKKLESGEKKTEESEPNTEDNFITLRIFGNDINTFNTAMEKLALVLGSDKSVSYRIMMALVDWLAGFNDDQTGRLAGKNAYLLSTIRGLVRQLDFKEPDLSERLIGIVAKGVEGNVAT